MRIFFGLLLALAGSLPAFSQELVTSLLPPKEAVRPGNPTELELIALNPGAGEASFAPASVMSATLVGPNGRSWPVQLQSISIGSLSVVPGGFGVYRYRLDLPADADGRIIIEVPQSGGQPLRGVIDVSRDAAPVAAAKGKSISDSPATTTVSKSLAVPPTAASTIPRVFAGRISPHEPIYFIYGADKPAAKFQFSFKYRLLSFGERSEESPSQNTLQF